MGFRVWRVEEEMAGWGGGDPTFWGHRAGRVLSAGPCRGAWRGRGRWGGTGAGARPDAGSLWVELVVGSPGTPGRRKQRRGVVEFADSGRGPECQVGTMCLLFERAATGRTFSQTWWFSNGSFSLLRVLHVSGSSTLTLSSQCRGEHSPLEKTR